MFITSWNKFSLRCVWLVMAVGFAVPSLQAVMDVGYRISDRGQSPSLLPPIAGGIPFRVMFIGASIVRGDMSTGNLGFRKPLRDEFVSSGNTVNLVGSQQLGNFTDNDLEAYPGNRVDQIHEHCTHIIPQTSPNLFIVHVGTNDCLQKFDVKNLGVRMKDLVNYLLTSSPKATVIMSTLITNTVPDMESCILDVNSQIRRVASLLETAGKPIVLAEMHYGQGLPGRPQPSDISPDGSHPFDPGYAMMAEIFWAAIAEADNKDFFQPPEINGIAEDGTAKKD
ncbi:SGNH hydrolase-type esterase domain-containing protein [Jackrogersella minutella]|nr:SGNH hydrolase-type esterase domain-containing protein [Jackrogersella minutella]